MPDALARAHALLAEHPLVDGHNDLLWEARVQVGYDFERLDISTRVASTVTDLPRLRAGGVGGQFWSVFVPSSLQGDAAVTATLEQIDGVVLPAWIEHQPRELLRAVAAGLPVIASRACGLAGVASVRTVATGDVDELREAIAELREAVSSDEKWVEIVGSGIRSAWPRSR